MNKQVFDERLLQKFSQYQTLNKIKSAFGLSEDELAKVLLVSRKTLNKWRNNTAEPMLPAVKRIFKLRDIADSWAHAGFADERRKLVQPILEGKTVLDMLSEVVLDSQSILYAGSALYNMLEPTHKIKDPFLNIERFADEKRTNNKQRTSS